MATSFEYGTVEWLWDQGAIRINLPGNVETKSSGSYNEVVVALTGLGAKGWEVVTCTSAGNWLFWTLKRISS